MKIIILDTLKKGNFGANTFVGRSSFKSTLEINLQNKKIPFEKQSHPGKENYNRETEF